MFGFGIDTVSVQRSACEAMAAVIKPGGWLLLGWNKDRITDPILKDVIAAWFDPLDFGHFCAVYGL